MGHSSCTTAPRWCFGVRGRKYPNLAGLWRSGNPGLVVNQELLARRTFGPWKSGADWGWRRDRTIQHLVRDTHDNYFEFSDDPSHRKCPCAAHIRKVYPRDYTARGAEVQSYRIRPRSRRAQRRLDESVDRMFVPYQTSIARQLEFIQSRCVHDPNLSTESCGLAGT
jgi:hypothetical protein